MDHSPPMPNQNVDGGSTDVERHNVEAVNAANAPRRVTLYAARTKIHPKRASGDFRRFKWLIMAVTLGIYYAAPWLRWDRGPYAPDQAILIDLAHRRFYFFFIEIWPQEFYYVAGLLIMAGVGLFLVTSVVGRAWCGYTCPQTVWTDLFLVIERWVEGDRNARIKLDAAPWSLDKLRKRLAKHAIWLVIGVATGGAWIFYFADAPSLARDLVSGNAAPVAYSSVALLTATTYVLAGFMREQVCIYMCPWPRIQAAMVDEDSLVVTYNAWRGEPRSLHRKKLLAEGKSAGDCVDCNACVAVCPMGIDIRDGQQLACITCALCIDACDSVMDKIGKPRGLISYSSLKAYEVAKSYTPRDLLRHALLRPRTIVYSGLWLAAGLVMLIALSMRERLDINVVPDRNPLFVTLSDGSIRNGYTIKILNMEQRPRTFRLSIEGAPSADMTLAGSQQPSSRVFDIDVEADKLRSIKAYVVMPRSAIPGDTMSFSFVITDATVTEDAERSEYPAIFHGPSKAGGEP
ncbi:cytochrome c oxidase accessory protein CcoG [Taklimakanibacter lacteus]|uniref:cytochrome c oxidase accessory protein CcoG n=1 Tax=Taklimakanibacter lacteus TaxID=2268456 RepID=UPI000E67386E